MPVVQIVWCRSDTMTLAGYTETTVILCSNLAIVAARQMQPLRKKRCKSSHFVQRYLVPVMNYASTTRVDLTANNEREQL